MSDSTDSDDTTLTLADVMETAATQIESEVEEFNGDMPNHAVRLLVRRAADMIETTTRIDVYGEREDVEITDEEIKDSLEDDAVDVLLALGAVQFEHDLDIVDAFRERMELMEAIQNHDSMEDIMREIMDDEEFEEAMQQMQGPQPGDDVSDDDYDGEPRAFS